ncbi:hypothetical protein PTSG_06837 [Salpingoeca rosetta]|uniref:Uncharacterized protein n=1 Tax=Salpingoeca rosetta (strain ATCC 50818 / BSB-021) TaxID=946362 RepID=F2UEY4_SALR5|nr:uncharacterized protein PTSG_06837 [Salpingoeca rosetta]EGD75184.1 hypothetical protein PTSG_06837 [Salpingoeca rosetta]|eukprot:XP_004992237.1 hypothetical protein PTSG_06837 [Salpingoeca rosetta]
MHVFRSKDELEAEAAEFGSISKFGDHVAAPLQSTVVFADCKHVHIAELPPVPSLEPLHTYSPEGIHAYPHSLGPLPVWTPAHHKRPQQHFVNIKSVDAKRYGSDTSSYLLASSDTTFDIVLSWEAVTPPSERSTDTSEQDRQDESRVLRIDAGRSFEGRALPSAYSRTRLHPTQEGHLAYIRMWTNSIHLLDQDKEVRMFKATRAPRALAYVQVGPEDTTLLAVTEGGMISAWDARSPKPVMREQYSASCLLALAGQDGMLTCAGLDRSVDGIDPRTWHVCGAWKSALKYDVGMVSMSPRTPGVCCAASGGDSEIAWGTWMTKNKHKHKTSRLTSDCVFRADARWCGISHLPDSDDVVGMTTTGHAYVFRNTVPSEEGEQQQGQAQQDLQQQAQQPQEQKRKEAQRRSSHGGSDDGKLPAKKPKEEEQA